VNRTEFLEGRRKGIGSSDVAPVLGLSPWGSPLTVYLDKIGQPESDELSPPLEWGIRKEAVIAAAVMDKTGWSLEKVPTATHRHFDFLIASVDRVNQDGDIIEIKTSGFTQGWGEPETDDVPEHVWLQVQHQLEVLDQTDTAWVYVLIGSCDFRRYRVERDPEYLETVIDPLTEFWKCVESRTPPEIDFADANALAAVQRLYQPKPGTMKVLEPEAVSLVEQYADLGTEITRMGKERDAIKARLIAELGDFETGLLTDGRHVRRKLTERKGYVVEPSTYFDFRILKGSK
jgi:putative phage-type endonuclease